MTIQPSGPSRSRLDGTVPARSNEPVPRATDGPSARRTDTPAASSRDVLDLSPAARALVARPDEDGALPGERLLQLRERVLDGSYDSYTVSVAVARSLLQHGALR